MKRRSSGWKTAFLAVPFAILGCHTPVSMNTFAVDKVSPSATSPRIFTRQIAGYPSLDALKGSKDLVVVGYVQAEGRRDLPIEKFLDAVRQKGQQMGCDALVDLTTLDLQPGAHGYTVTGQDEGPRGGNVIWQFACAVAARPGGSPPELAAPTSSSPDRVSIADPVSHARTRVCRPDDTTGSHLRQTVCDVLGATPFPDPLSGAYVDLASQGDMASLTPSPLGPGH